MVTKTLCVLWAISCGAVAQQTMCDVCSLNEIYGIELSPACESRCGLTALPRAVEVPDPAPVVDPPAPSTSRAVAVRGGSTTFRACRRSAERIGKRGVGMYSSSQFAARVQSDANRRCFFRTVDGTSNSLHSPTQGSSGTVQTRMTTANGDTSGPSPRSISNTVLKEVGDPLDPNLSAFAWQWLQFIVHGITRVDTNNNACAGLRIPAGDPCIPRGARISFCESVMRNGTPVNSLSSFIDGSQVYGSTARLASELRGGGPGKLLISQTRHGPLLPPAQEGREFPLFKAGDVRANENPALLAIHTLFVREHNRLVDEAVANSGGGASLSDDQLFEFAKERNVAQMQAITFNEVLPVFIGNLSPYTKYKPGVDPTLSVEFTSMALRIGDSMVNEGFLRLNRNGGSKPEGDISLRDSFFQPSEIWNNGIDGLLRGLVATPSRAVDTMIVDGLRNFLFGPPVDGVSALDLGSINIQRGRSNGVPKYNVLRAALGLPRKTSMDDVSSDASTVARLNQAYANDVEAVDAWVGAMAEDKVGRGVTGQLSKSIIKKGFTKMRDGDRFWYENPDLFTPDFIAQIKATTLADIIKRNTGIGQTAWDTQAFSGSVFTTTNAQCQAEAGCGSDPMDMCVNLS